MGLISHDRLESTPDGFMLVIYLHPQQTEFAQEAGAIPGQPTPELAQEIKAYAQWKYPSVKVTLAKLMIGSMLVATIPLMTREASAAAATKPTIEYVSHRVATGESAWSISVAYGIPMHELLRVNRLPRGVELKEGQELRIPIHHIPITPTTSPKHGEYLDWWTEAQYVFSIGKVATVTDVETGISFQVKRTIGANHADCEPLTAKDAAIIKKVWGGRYRWTERAVIVAVDGRKIAASMASEPHGVEYIKDNHFPGHFDIHFAGSTRHKDGLVNHKHQAQIKVAAGLV